MKGRTVCGRGSMVVAAALVALTGCDPQIDFSGCATDADCDADERCEHNAWGSYCASECQVHGDCEDDEYCTTCLDEPVEGALGVCRFGSRSGMRCSVPCADCYAGCCRDNVCMVGTMDTACGARGYPCVNCAVLGMRCTEQQTCE